MKTLWCIIVGVALALAQDAPRSTATPVGGSVEGKVTNVANGEPVRKAAVVLESRNAPASAGYVAETDGNGHFLIEGVAPGEYTIGADRQGFEIKLPGAAGAPLPPVKVAAGESVRGLVVPLSPLGVITGRVIDEDGDPVRGAQVHAMQYGYQAGKRQLRQVSQAQSNDKGEFRLFGLRPGTFYLEAVGRNGPFNPVPPGVKLRGAGQPVGYSQTYFPSTTDVARAVPIEMAAGDLLRGMDIRLRRERQLAVRGKFPPEDNRPMPGGYMVQLVPREGRGTPAFGSHRTNELFEFPNVAPGSYVILGMRIEGNARTYARQYVDVANEDVDVGLLSFSPGFDLSGSVRLEGKGALQPDLRISLQSDGPGSFNFPSGDVKPDGTFVLHDVAPAVYNVNLGLRAGTYLKSVRLGDQPPHDGPVDLTQGGGPLSILLANDVARVEGAVKTTSGDPAARVRVTLVPIGDHIGRQNLSRFGFSDEKGAYEIKNVPPGDYKIFAWENVDQGAPQDPDFRKPFEKRGIALKVEPNGLAKADVTVITVAEMQHTDPQ